MKAVLKHLSTTFFVAFLAITTGCGSGGISDESSNDTDIPAPQPPTAKPSATVLDVRQDGDDLVVDLLVSDATGQIVTGMRAVQFVTQLTDSVSLTGTPSSFDVEVLPGSYSAVALLDQSESVNVNDEFDLRLTAMKKLYSVLTNASEIYTIAFAGSADQPRDPNEDLPEQFYEVSSGFVMSVADSSIDQLAQWENGGSPVFDALLHAISLAPGGSNSVKVVILLSDGDNDNGTSIDEVINAANAAGIRIVAIGLGYDETGQANVIQLANSTGGAYSLLEGAEQLDSLVGGLNTWLTTLDPTVIQTARTHYTVRLSSVSSLSGNLDVDINGETITVAITVE